MHGESPVKRHQDRPDQRAGKKRIQVFRRVEGQHGHTITLLNAIVFGQIGCQGTRAQIERLIRQTSSSFTIDQADFMGSQLFAPGQPFA